ncbi:hypothetical protein [Spongiibacter marinus]|uniref:hypothetical protein n=1 Tax=Spongiibacter marinus TaxID=354246 RepID=UPI000489C514|nr:hypothetical protein [Spongiibacter marinus]
MDEKYDVKKDITEARRKMLMADVATAEGEARPYLEHARGKLLMGSDYGSFGGLMGTTGASVKDFDKLTYRNRSIWVACRLWAICQKIKKDPSPGPEAGQELNRYANWLLALQSHRDRSFKGGSKRKGYSADLDAIIKEIIGKVQSEDPPVIKNQVFLQLPGSDLDDGVIDSIGKERNTVIVNWSSEAAGDILRRNLTKGAIDKRVERLLQEAEA